MPTREFLSLLPAFQAIYDERNLSRAAEKLGVTQSALSQSLAKLRLLTSDELFRSTGRGVRPTPRAEQMISHVRAVLAEVDAVARPHLLDLSALERTFAIDAGIGLDILLLPGVYGPLRRAAPGAKLKLCCPRKGDPANVLQSAEVDLVIDFLPPTASGISFQPILTSPTVVISRADHPLVEAGLTESRYWAADHATLDWLRTAGPSWLALELARLGSRVHSAVEVANLASLASIVASSDLIATVTEAIAKDLCTRFPLAVHNLPVPIRPLTLYLVWHERFENDTAHTLLRTLFARSASAAA